jgi:hypothetical protein
MAETFLEEMEDWQGYQSVHTKKVNEAALVEMLRLLNNADGLPKHAIDHKLQEAATTSDFPYLLGQVLDRQLIANYKLPGSIAEWRQYIKVGSVPNFNPVERMALNGADQYLDEVMKEDNEYPLAKASEQKYSYSVKKRGKRFSISWESLVNDALGAFTDIPQRFANAALRTEARFATSLIALSSGPNTALYGATISDAGQAITNLGALALTIENLETTLTLMSEQKDPQGEPILVEGTHLVVPPHLFLTAKSILTSTSKFYVDVQGGAGASITAYPTTNVLQDMPITLHKNAYLPIIDTSGNKNGTWYLFADPAQGVAAEVGFLRGYENPDIVMKASNKMSVAGGVGSTFDGDFESDNIQYRVRHILGGTAMNPRYTFAQVHA